MTRTFSLRIVFAIFCAMLGSTPARPVNVDRPAPEPKEKQKPDVPPGCILIGDSVICPETEQEAAAVLLTNGPSTYFSGDMTQFSVNGFVRDQWPFVVDFQSQPNTRTKLVVSLFKQDRSSSGQQFISIPIDLEGPGRRQLLHIPALDIATPDASGARPVHVASFMIVSNLLKANGKVSRKRAPVIVYGIGAGPAAVGSVTVNNVNLAPAGLQLRIPADKKTAIPVRFGYNLKRSFPLVAVTVWNDCRKLFCKSVNFAPPPAAAVSGPKSGNWLLKGSAKEGFYRLFVRAWLSCAGNVFPNCGDDAAWATGLSPLGYVAK